MARGFTQRVHFITRYFVIVFFLPAAVVESVDSITDGEVLLRFKSSLNHNGMLNNWNTSMTPCVTKSNVSNWFGVLCSTGKIYGLKLEKLNLSGTIDVDTLTKLSLLRTISFMNNQFNGILPEVKKLKALRSLYFSNNHFGDEIHTNAFDGMLHLKKVHLAENNFIGKIPSSLATLPKLLELKLQGNQFDGEIPNFVSKDLNSLDLSNNSLAGRIPSGLENFSKSQFTGNKNLCGKPLQQCQNRASKKPIIITSTFIIVTTMIILIACLLIPKLRRRRHSDTTSALTANSDQLDQMERGSTASNTSSKRSDKNKLFFLKHDNNNVGFEMSDLLKASAEVLGSESYLGSSYKAKLVSGKTMVVKRFRDMNNLDREEFHEHMRKLGRLNHRNLLPISAYYYRKEEKLLITEFVVNGSLAANIHGNRAGEKPRLDWKTRLKILKGISKGLLYLHTELPNLTIPHGHLKSSNVLLTDSYEPLLNEYGLINIINQQHAHEHMIPYKSPEYINHGRITKKTDVWCFGIVILETLTSKIFSVNQIDDFSKWVNSMIDEDRAGEVFGKDMMMMMMKMGSLSKSEMLKMLKIGVECCESDVEKRLELKEVVERIDEVRELTSSEEVVVVVEEKGDEFFSTRTFGEVNSS